MHATACPAPAACILSNLSACQVPRPTLSSYPDETGPRTPFFFFFLSSLSLSLSRAWPWLIYRPPWAWTLGPGVPGQTSLQRPARASYEVGRLVGYPYVEKNLCVYPLPTNMPHAARRPLCLAAHFFFLVFFFFFSFLSRSMSRLAVLL